MKKLSSMLALSLVLAMVLGMTAFAAGSADTQVDSATEGVTVGQMEDLSEAQTQSLAQKVVESIPAGSKDQPPITVCSIDLNGTVPKDGKVTLAVKGITVETAANNVYKALHLVDGVWNVHPVTVNSDGTITISGIDSFSPFVIVAYEKAGETSSNKSSGSKSSGSEKTDEAVSPKTGETVPVEVMVAMIALFGAAAVGTRKVLAER